MNGDAVKGMVKTSISYMLFSSVLGIALGLIMLFYPGGTMVLMEAAFTFLQIILTIFIIYYTLSEAIHYFKASHAAAGAFYCIIGAVATALIWLFNVGIIFYVIAFFLILTGIGDIVGGFRLPRGRGLLILLGIINILIAAVILRNPIILPLLIAWYVLFWGISRLILSIELRKAIK